MLLGNHQPGFSIYAYGSFEECRKRIDVFLGNNTR